MSLVDSAQECYETIFLKAYFTPDGEKLYCDCKIVINCNLDYKSLIGDKQNQKLWKLIITIMAIKIIIIFNRHNYKNILYPLYHLQMMIFADCAS